MAVIYKLIIRFYWLVVPNKIKGICLFEESCSNHVYRVLHETGVKGGMAAFKYRYSVCRHPFVIRKNMRTNRFELHLCNGEIIDEREINSYYKKTPK